MKTLRSCKNGFERSAKTRRCIKKCPSGSSRNATSGKCKKDKKVCPPGSSRNPSSGRCKKDGSRPSKPSKPVTKIKKLPKMEDYDEFDLEEFNSSFDSIYQHIKNIPKEAAILHYEKGLVWDEDGKYLGKIDENNKRFIKP